MISLVQMVALRVSVLYFYHNVTGTNMDSRTELESMFLIFVV